MSTSDAGRAFHRLAQERGLIIPSFLFAVGVKGYGHDHINPPILLSQRHNQPCCQVLRKLLGTFVFECLHRFLQYAGMHPGCPNHVQTAGRRMSDVDRYFSEILQASFRKSENRRAHNYCRRAGKRDQSASSLRSSRFVQAGEKDLQSL